MTAEDFASGCSARFQKRRNQFLGADLSRPKGRLCRSLRLPSEGRHALHQKVLQPNVHVSGVPLSWRFLILLIPVGIGAGIAAGLLMWLLRAVQHFFWSYPAGEFVTAVEHAGPAQRIGILLLAGLLAGCADWAIKRQPGGQRIYRKQSGFVMDTCRCGKQSSARFSPL